MSRMTNREALGIIARNVRCTPLTLKSMMNQFKHPLQNVGSPTRGCEPGRSVRQLLMLVSLLVLLFLVIVLIGNLTQLADAVDRLAPGWGTTVFLVLLGGFMALLIAPVVLFYRLPPALIPPTENAGPAHTAYLAQLKSRLRDNPLLSGETIETDEDLQRVLLILSEEASREVKNTASGVFVSTAVMQNGRLDGLIVLVSQLRMVWRIASIYFQRPSPRQLLYLYGNVGANVLVADSLQEIEFTEIATPIVTSIIPSLKGAVPGMQGIATLLVNSLANGAANAFLTLRIGIITRAYCMATSEPAKGAVKQGATLTALTLVKDIAREQGARVVSHAWEVVRGTVETTVDSTVQGTKEAVSKVAITTVESVRSAGNALERGWEKLKDTTGRLVQK